VLGWPIVIFQVLRHILFIKVTGLSPMCAGLGYTYLARGDRLPGLSEEEIKRV
jgi:hypothetical protein